MLRRMLRPLADGLCVFLILCAAATAARGQAKDPRVISAAAGGINFVSGEVKVKAFDGGEWQALTDKDSLASGNTVATGAGARVEVLLNPGSYFRAGENAEFTLVDDSLDSLRLRLTKGDAIVEATGFDGLRVEITVETPHTLVRIARSGLYRVGVSPLNVTQVAVVKGRAYVGAGEKPLRLRGGDAARAGRGGVELARLDKKQKDEFDLWSRERAKTLAEVNRKLSWRDVNARLAGISWADVWSPAAYVANMQARGPIYVSGAWYYDPGRSCWTFLPGSYTLYQSPYGFSYGNAVNYGFPNGEPSRQCPGCVNNQIGGVGNNGVVATGPGVGSNYGNGNGSPGNNHGGNNAPTPSAAPAPVTRGEFVRPSFDSPRPVTVTRDQ